MRRSISASPVETSWMTAERPEARSASIARISEGHFMAVSRWPKKRCLAPSKADIAAALALTVQRVLAVDDAGRLQRLLDVSVDDLEGAGIGVVDAPLFRRQLVFEDLDLDPVK